ncbi:MAG: polyprenyl synthetase family protein [Bdellovibrionales bacterium]|nr:polyprenyl synthetase family protein [Bdellovibrionales bacterium]
MKPESSPTGGPASDLESAIVRLARESLRGVPARLGEAMLYSWLGPGKRMRPRLVLAVAQALRLDNEIAYSLGAAIEAVHAYTLVHDDLPALDNDDLRRGRPTNHKVFGEGLALLAGDALALAGPELVLGLRGRIPADRLTELLAAILEAAGARGVIAGQAEEPELKAASGNPAALYEVFRKKTGALFRAALTLPAIAAGADAPTREALGRLGDEIGVSFQIADDLEDDFAAKKGDAAHVAAYLSPAAARAEAERRLDADAALSPALREALAPFLAELRKKLA